MPLPAPLPPWAKAVLNLAPFAFAGGEALFDHFSESGSAADLAWLHVTCHAWRSTPSGTQEDRAQIGFDVCKLNGGVNDATWDTAQITGATDKIKSLLGFLAGYQDNNCAWNEIRSYVKRFNEIGPGFAPMGDPVHVETISVIGSSSATNVLPYQVALSVTEKTALRKHWGRVYVPCPSTTTLDAWGRYDATTCAAIATIFADAYLALANANYVVVVPSGGSRALLTVTSIQVDDIPDVQRRRRARTTVTRAVRPVV